jgi:hypothetical protein
VTTFATDKQRAGEGYGGKFRSIGADGVGYYETDADAEADWHGGPLAGMLATLNPPNSDDTNVRVLMYTSDHTIAHT